MVVDFFDSTFSHALLSCEKVKYELQVQIQELRIQIHELWVQIHELRGQIHELEH